MPRRRLDAELVRRGLVRSREEAREAVSAGLVLVGGTPADKPARLVDEGEPLHLEAAVRRFVSRGGEKLDAALDRFPVAPDDRECLDAGASTGGFTDVLLRRGARRVVAVDVGYGQLDWSLRTDPRVVVIERTNVRDLVAGSLPVSPSIVVADLSFISLTVVLPALVRIAAAGADLVLLVKPQFEADRRAVSRGGVVRDPAVWRAAIGRVADACAAAGAASLDVMVSPLPGPAGNIEFLLHARIGATPTAIPVDAAIADAERIAGAA
ncbi:MAG: TlyA family RNA methyltransferase [Actinomycetota bacterium]